MITWIIVGVVAVLLVLGMICVYNSCIIKINKVEEVFSTKYVYMKKRWDMVPNLVATVKGYAKQESETLSEFVMMRSGASYDSLSTNEKFESNKKLSQGIGKLFALAESYPDLKASANFQDLSGKLTKCEDEIANSRQCYNGTVREFNNTIQVFLNVIFANMFGFKKFNMYEIDAKERENIKLIFGRWCIC